MNSIVGDESLQVRKQALYACQTFDVRSGWNINRRKRYIGHHKPTANAEPLSLNRAG